MPLYYVDVTDKQTGKKSSVYCIAVNAVHLRRIMSTTMYKISEYGKCGAQSWLKIAVKGLRVYAQLGRVQSHNWHVYYTLNEIYAETQNDNGKGRAILIEHTV